MLTEHATRRQSNLLTAEVVRGTCPDMCPEKERYMREDRRRLSVYEMVPGTDLVRGTLCFWDGPGNTSDVQPVTVTGHLRMPGLTEAK